MPVDFLVISVINLRFGNGFLIENLGIHIKSVNL